MKTAMVWCVTPCSLVDAGMYRCWVRLYRHHVQCRIHNHLHKNLRSWHLSEEVHNVPCAFTKTLLFACSVQIRSLVNILCYLITWDLRRLEFIVYQCYHQHLPLDQYCLLPVQTRSYLMFPIYSTESISPLQFSRYITKS
jgi:hypothetical protein